MSSWPSSPTSPITPGSVLWCRRRHWPTTSIGRPIGSPPPWPATATTSSRASPASRPSRTLCWTSCPPAVDPEGPMSNEQAPGGRTRVVIAEDEAIIRMDLVETLAEEGYEVVGQCGSGGEVIDLVAELH